MVEGDQEGIPLYVLENRVKLTEFIERNLEDLEGRFPVQVGAAKKVIQYLRASDELGLITQKDLDRIAETNGYSKTSEERETFVSALRGLLTLEKLSKEGQQQLISNLGEELGLIL